MAWLRLMRSNGKVCLVNSDQISDVYAYAAEENAAIRGATGITIVRESVDEIAAMIADAERAELVTRFAVAIVGSDYDGPGARFEPDTIWRMAAEYVDARPEIGGES